MNNISKEHIKHIISDILKEHSIYFTLTETDKNIYETNLSELGVDSLLFIRFIIRLEDEFHIEIPIEYLNYTRMSNINLITEIVKKVKERETT